MGAEIDFTKPSPTIEDLLFDVELRDLYSKFKPDNKQVNVKEIRIPNYKAVVNSNTGAVISVVSDDYKLISNKEAIEIGTEIFSRLYPQVDIKALIPFRVVAPQTMGSAHVDLIHRDVNFDVWEQEKWLPFIRISNSYNRTVALSYEIGFVRALCSNGVLFKKDTMQLKYFHIKENRIDIEKAVAQIGTSIDQFKGQCTKLSELEFPRKFMVPLVFNTLNVNLKTPYNVIDDRKWKRINSLIETTHNLTQLYFDAIGDNAYSAFNVLSDLVSNGDVNCYLPGYYLHVRSYFCKPNSWAEQFIQESDKKDFKITNYLENTIQSLNDWKQNFYLHWELN